MKTQNVVIGHCLSCGSIVHCEADQELPDCCGRPMVRAATASHTVMERRNSELGVDDRANPDRPPGELPGKPR